MFSSIYASVDYIPCAVNGYNSNVNPLVGYKWYQSCLSSDMASTGSVTVAPCYFTTQVALPPQLVSNPNMYYAHEYEPPPVSLPYFYSPMSSAPQLFTENCNKQSASKVFDESPSRKSMVKTQVPGPIICNVSTSLSSTTSLLQGSETNYEAPGLLSFDGTDPRSWILKVGIYINGSDAEKIYLAGSHFRGKAKVWYRCFYETRKGEVGWKKFLHDLLIRFDSFKLDNPCYLVNPLSLEQFSSVAEYEINFLQTKEISEFVYEFLFTEEMLVHNFISGLKKDIRERVSLLSPMTLQGAINLAKFQALQIEKEMLFEATEEENEMGEDKAIVEEFSMVKANGTEFNQTPGGQYVQNQRNEVWNGPIGDGSFSGGSRQEKSRSEFQNDGKVLGRFDREGRVNEFCGNGSGGGNIGEVSRQPGVFSKESISNPQSSFGRGFGADAVQQKQNQFYGVGSSVVNGTYEQSVVHFQQSSGNYSVGNMRNVGTAQMGSSNVRKGSSDSFYGNNFYGDVGSHQQNPYGYHGNKVENYNGYTVGNTQDYQQNPNAMGSATNGGLVEANECYQPKQTVEEVDDLCQEGKLKEAIELLVLLEQQGLSVNMARYFMLMKACGEAKAVEEAKHVHDLFIGRKFPAEISSYNKILEIYCVCGSMDDAYDVFTNMPNRNLTSWDTMILWLAKNGRGKVAIDMFNRFKELGLQPDGEIFFSVFSACSFLGDITEGLLHFESMSKQYGIVPSMQHYIAVVDMLGSTGYLDEALEFIENMPVEPNIDVWETLMNSCRVNGYTELGDRCAELVELLDPSRLSEQSKAGLIPVKASDVAKEKEKKKLTSQNLLEVRSRVHEYRAGDTSHPDSDKIYALLRGLRQQMKEAGYVAETKFVLHDIDQEGKEDALLAHSERLAVAQGLLSSPARQQIRVIKNLRVCGDCHNAIKIISKLVGREFVMRDAKRFHHFKDGVCSCRDYW